MAGWLGGYFTPNPAGQAAILSGAVGSGDLDDNVVFSGNIASGQIGRFHIASGQLAGFELGSGAIVSGRIASGQIAKNHTASGFVQAAIQFVIDGGGTALASGLKGDIIVPFDCRINYVNVFSDVSGGSIFAGIWRDAYANFPPTSGDTIAPSGVPLISGAIRNSYSGTAALSGWTTALTKGDVLRFVIHSGLTMTRVTLALQVGVGD